MMRQRVGGLLKQADGGDGRDQSFEQAFSDLAHSVIQDKAPGLFDYELGFQLLDRNEDNSKAAGILGFKIGEQLLYVPVFFVDGDIKSAEHLYLQGQNLFVPLRENWINYLKNKKPLSLGSGVTRDLSRLGVRAPEFFRITRSPTKFAAALPTYAAKMPPWVQEVLPGLAHALTTDPFAGAPTLPDYLADGPVKLAAALHRFVETYPQLGGAIDRFHGEKMAAALGRLSERLVANAKAASAGRRPSSALEARALPLRSRTRKGAAVQVVTYDTALRSPLAAGADEDAERLLEDGYLIRDARPDDEVAVVAKFRAPLALTNPDETGLYELLTEAGPRKCAVVMNPHGPHGRLPHALVVEASGDGRRWAQVHPRNLWVVKAYDRRDWEQWVDGLPDASFSDSDGTFAILTPRRDGSCPLRFSGRDSASTFGLRTADAWFLCDAVRGAGADVQTGDRPGERGQERSIRATEIDRPDCCADSRVALGAPNTAFRSSRGTLYCPPDAKRLGLQSGYSGRSEDRLLAGDGLVPPEDLLQQKLASVGQPLSVWARRGEYHIDNGPPLSHRGALVALVTNHHLREKQAREVLSEAEVAGRSLGGGPAKFRVLPPLAKSAAGMEPELEGPLSPSMVEPPVMTGSEMSADQATRFPYEVALPVQSLQADPGAIATMRPNAPVRPDPESLSPPDPNSARVVDEAARTGQREVFDTSVLAGLLQSGGQDEMVDRYLGDLTKGMDRLGRMLLQMYWFGDRYEERYGKERRPVLEAAFKNVFRDLGDIVLELRQKAIDADPVRALRKTEIDEQVDA